MSYKKVVFLDIDGVLNNGYTTQKTPSGYTGIDPELVKNLKSITHAHPDAVLVLSSTWRLVDDPDVGIDFPTYDLLFKYLAEQGVDGIVDITPTITDHDWVGPVTRGDEIRAWFKEGNKADKYVILDDVPYGIQHTALEKRWVQTHPFEGLTQQAAQKAIDLLNV